MEHLAEFGNLSVYPPLLFLESENGSIEDFGGEFVGRHKNQYGSHISCAASSGVLGWK